MQRRLYSQLIKAKDLSALLASNHKVHILEGGFPSVRTHFLKSRLPNSHFFDIDEISDPTTSFPYMLADAETFRKAMRSFAIPKDDSLVVCYDRSSMISACRVWWNLKAFGRKNVAVLDGGFGQWVESGCETHSGDLQAENTEESRPGYEEYELETGHYASFDKVKAISSLLARRNPQTNTQLMDVRPPAAFLGLTPITTPGLRAGHIPGAINLPASKFLTDQRTMQSPETLKQVFTEFGVSLDERCPTIAYCSVGLTACLGMFALTLAGKSNVSVYDGSWSEYVRGYIGNSSA